MASSLRGRLRTVALALVAARARPCAPLALVLHDGRVDATLCNGNGNDRAKSCVVLVGASFAGGAEVRSSMRDGDVPVWDGEVLELGCAPGDATLTVSVFDEKPNNERGRHRLIFSEEIVGWAHGGAFAVVDGGAENFVNFTVRYDAYAPTYAPSFGETYAPSVTAPPSLDRECTDVESAWMEENAYDCENAADDYFADKCDGNKYWVRKHYCEQRCADLGYGYVDIDCAASRRPTVAPAPRPRRPV